VSLFCLCRPNLPNDGFFDCAVIQISIAAIKNAQHDPDWLSYFRLCFAYWKNAYVCYPVMLYIAQANLSAALQAEVISSHVAKEMMEAIRDVGKHHDGSNEVVSTAVLDFDLALKNLQAAKMDSFAKQFDELVLFGELTVTDYESSVETAAD
jgi:hypothetical protein